MHDACMPSLVVSSMHNSAECPFSSIAVELAATRDGFSSTARSDGAAEAANPGDSRPISLRAQVRAQRVVVPPESRRSRGREARSRSRSHCACACACACACEEELCNARHVAIAHESTTICITITIIITAGTGTDKDMRTGTGVIGGPGCPDSGFRPTATPADRTFAVQVDGRLPQPLWESARELKSGKA